MDAAADAAVGSGRRDRISQDIQTQKEIVEYLLDAGADVHFLSDLALRGAAEFGQTEVVMLLLDHGADVHARDDSALRLAKKNHHKGTATFLKNFMKWG